MLNSKKMKTVDKIGLGSIWAASVLVAGVIAYISGNNYGIIAGHDQGTSDARIESAYKHDLNEDGEDDLILYSADRKLTLLIRTQYGPFVTLDTYQSEKRDEVTGVHDSELESLEGTLKSERDTIQKYLSSLTEITTKGED